MNDRRQRRISRKAISGSSQRPLCGLATHCVSPLEAASILLPSPQDDTARTVLAGLFEVYGNARDPLRAARDPLGVGSWPNDAMVRFDGDREGLVLLLSAGKGPVSEKAARRLVAMPSGECRDVATAILDTLGRCRVTA